METTIDPKIHGEDILGERLLTRWPLPRGIRSHQTHRIPQGRPPYLVQVRYSCPRAGRSTRVLDDGSCVCTSIEGVLHMSQCCLLTLAC